MATTITTKTSQLTQDKETIPQIYQLKISIADARPAIWRRVLVPARTTLAELHRIIQAVIGWEDAHLHKFEAPGPDETSLKTRRSRQNSVRFSSNEDPFMGLFANPAWDDLVEEGTAESAPRPVEESPKNSGIESQREAVLKLLGPMAASGSIPVSNDAPNSPTGFLFDEENEEQDEATAFLNEVAPAIKYHFLYTYDMGDSWEHDIVVEKILPADPDGVYPICVAGERHGPMEDCGGIWGYEYLLEVLADPTHEEHKERKTWLRDAFGIRKWDANAFDLEATNKRLAKLRPKAKRSSRRRKE